MPVFPINIVVGITHPSEQKPKSAREQGSIVNSPLTTPRERLDLSKPQSPSQAPPQDEGFIRPSWELN